MRTEPSDNPNRERSYLNTILTVIACLLAVIAFDLVVGTPAPSEAMAAGRASAPLGQPNPEAQRLEMITELRKINRELKEIRSAIGGTIDVDVIRMPAGGNGD